MKNQSERFTNAVTKLYNAFHENTLNAMDCQKCAVGNLVSGDINWVKIIASHRFNTLTLDIPNVMKTGYSAHELANIENLFMFGVKVCVDSIWSKKLIGKEKQFKGLCAVVEYLCELEGIPNVMDYTILFETENNEPKHKLEEVLC